MRKLWTVLILITSLGLLAAAGCGSVPAASRANQGATHTVVDTAGRQVVLPVNITRIADVGPTPPMNSLLFLFGAGDKLVNGLPAQLNKPDFAWQKVFAPHMATNPTVEGNIGQVNTEALATLHPQVVLTNFPAEVAPLQAAGFKVVVISWSNPAGLERAVTVMGDVLGQPARAAQYISYLHDSIHRVQADLAGLSAHDQSRVAYLADNPLGEPGGSEASYWLHWAGAVDVEAPSDASGHATYSVEQILAWNPQVILTQARSDAYAIEHDARFANVAAVKDHRVYVVPAAAQHWGNSTSETPLVVLWTAKLLHPRHTADINVEQSVGDFYRNWYGTTLSDVQLTDILHTSLEPQQVAR